MDVESEWHDGQQRFGDDGERRDEDVELLRKVVRILLLEAFSGFTTKCRHGAGEVGKLTVGLARAGA